MTQTTKRFDPATTALVVTDPQNDFLSPDGVTWGVVGESVVENGTVDNIESLFKAAKENGFPVFISPHYYYPHDHGWKFEGTLEKLMHDIKMFDRGDALSLDGFEGSGADWLERYKPYIQDGQTVVVSPHKVYGPETNDLVLQLRKRGIDTVILAGRSREGRDASAEYRALRTRGRWRRDRRAHAGLSRPEALRLENRCAKSPLTPLWERGEPEVDGRGRVAASDSGFPPFPKGGLRGDFRQ